MLRAIDEYQKDCWALCLATGQAGYRKRLGMPFDKDLDNGEDDSISPLARGLSPALTRLLACDSAGWFAKNISATVRAVGNMCSSSPACAGLCSGTMDPDEAAEYSAIYKEVMVSVESLPPDERDSVSTPSILADLMMPIAQAAAVFAQYIAEDSAGTVVARYIDSIAHPVTGKCPGYDAALAGMRVASGGALSPFAALAPSDSLTTVRGVRNPSFGACLRSVQRLAAFCASSSGATTLCARAEAPNVDKLGAFDTCQDSDLAPYYGVVMEYNDLCGKIGFALRPMLGPARDYYYYADGGISMGECFKDKTGEIAQFFIIFGVIWIGILSSFFYARRTGRVWLAACDVTLDVSRSRAFTVSGTLWLLYFFYRYNLDVLSDVRLNRCTGVWPDCGPGNYFPFVLYVFAVCLMWVAAFSSIFVANNPYRRHGLQLSLVGIAVSHYFTFVVARQCLQDLDLQGNTMQLRGKKFFEIGLICSLQAAMDVCFLHLVVGAVLGWKTFQEIRGEAYAKHAAAALSRQSTDENKVLITCALPEGSCRPDRDAVSEDLAAWVGGRDHVVLVSVSETCSPGPVHVKRAEQLQSGATPIGVVFYVEAVLVNSAEDRAIALRAEERRAAEAGRLADAAWLRLERERAAAECPRPARRDAQLLAQMLRSEVFIAALADSHAERYFVPALNALHQYCRATAAAPGAKSGPATRARMLAAAPACGLGEKQAELLCCLPEAEAAALAGSAEAGTARKELMDRVDELYRQGRQELAARLASEQFLHWIDEGRCLDAEVGRARASNPFSAESAALDAFFLSAHGGGSASTAVPAAPYRVSQVRAGMVSDVKNGGGGQIRGRHGAFGRALGVSAQRERWEAWADDRKGLAHRLGMGDKVAFAPSLLFICVGIATIIILSSFVGQVSLAIATRDVLYDFIARLRNVNSIFQSMAIGTLNLASCADPVSFRAMQDTRLATYLPQLADWEPVSVVLQRAAESPDLAAALGDPPVLETLLDGSYFRDLKARILATVPNLVLSSALTLVSNVSQPAVLATLPVYGPTVSCLFTQFGSPEVQSFLNNSISTVKAETSKVVIRVPTESTDTCR
jgi:hypothetical protein